MLYDSGIRKGSNVVIGDFDKESNCLVKSVDLSKFKMEAAAILNSEILLPFLYYLPTEFGENFAIFM